MLHIGNCWSILQYKGNCCCTIEISLLQFLPMACLESGVELSFRPWLLQFKAYCTVLIAFSWSVYMLTQYTDCLARSMAFSMPMWFMWSYTIACSCNSSGSLILFPFMSIPLIIASSFLNVQYGLISWIVSFWFNGHPSIICCFSFCKWRSLHVASCMSGTDMHDGMSVITLMALMLRLMLCISSQLFLVVLSWKPVRNVEVGSLLL